MGIIISVFLDHFTVYRTHTACDISDPDTAQKVDQIAKKPDAQTAHRRGLKTFLCNKPGANGNIGLSIFDRGDQVFDIRRIMLAVAIKLYCDVIVVLQGIAIPGLDTAADA